MDQLKFLAQVPKITGTLKGVGELDNPGDQSGILLEKVISSVIGVMSIVAFIYFTFQIIFAGYGLMSANDDAQKIKQNTQKITQGLIGIVTVIAAVFLARLLGNLLGIDNILNINDWITNIITVSP